MSATSARSAIIVGGGISGLAAAYYLKKAGIPATLIDRQPHLGGVIRTDREQGCLLEAGPDSYLAAKPAAFELIRELGLENEVIGSNDHDRVTYVVRNGRLIPLPDGLMMMVPTKILPVALSPLLSWSTKIRMGLEFFRRPPATPPGDRSVADFITSHYGAETVEYLAEPLLAGVYGGDPATLSINSTLSRFVEIEQKYGSLTKGVLAGPKPKGGGSLFKTLKSGLGTLVDRLAPHVDKRIQGEAEALETNRVRVNGQWIEADRVILAAPAHESARLLEGIDAPLAATLAEIPYTSSTTVALVYDRVKLNHPLNGFGFLVPRRERQAIVACTWVNTKFSHRVPDNLGVLRCFLTQEAPLAEILADLRRLMGITAEPLLVKVNNWPRSMAQYTVGHAQRIASIRERAAHYPWFTLIGNAYEGIGIPDCIRLAKDTASGVAWSGPSAR